MDLMEQTAIILGCRGDKKKLTKLRRLLAQQNMYWDKYLKARKEFRELAGIT